MAKNYSYPRVTMKTFAKKHSNNVINVPDTTILFAPLVTEKGPDDRVVKVHSLAEFAEIFGDIIGSDKFYNLNGQMAINVVNWLSNGGTLLVKRLVLNESEKAYFDICSISNTENPEIPFEKDFTIEVKDDKDNVTASYTVKVKYIKDETGKAYKFEVKCTGTTCHYTESDGKLNIEIRSSDDSESLATGKILLSDIFKINSKFYGEYYDGITLEIEKVLLSETFSYYNAKFKKVTESATVVLEEHLSKQLPELISSLSASDYISTDSVLELSNFITTNMTKKFSTEKGANNKQVLKLESNIHGTINASTYANTITKLVEFWGSSENTDNYLNYLSNRLETPIDLVLDAGYPASIKTLLVDAFSNSANNENVIRADVILLLDEWETGLRLEKPTEVTIESLTDSDNKKNTNIEATNIATYQQYFTVRDEIFAGQDIYVTPSYFLSKKIPYLDNTYGMQYPIAGINRGILDDALWLNKNPNADQKEAWFSKRVNYAEKTAREISFMSQRTHDGSNDFNYTALSFLNNARVLEKIKKELEALARSYLHEFNDAITLSNMSAALNKYVAGWIANRTLSMGVVEVSQNAVSETALDVNLNIRFTNTIEVINVSIVIE